MPDFSKKTQNELFLTKRLRNTDQTMREIFNAISEGLVIIDGKTHEILAVNRRMTEMFGFTEAEFKRLGPAVISTPAKLEEALDCIRKTITVGPQPPFERETLDRQGRRLILEINSSPVTIGGKVCSLASIHDVTSHKQQEKSIERMLMKDPLTGAYNRNYFEADMLRAETDGRRKVGIFACDVDGLKLINDTLGFEQGDELLKKVAGILQAGIQESGYVAAIGGGEFAVVVYEPTKDVMEELDRYYRNAVDAYNRDYPNCPLSLSMGWAIDSESAVIKSAENSMYRQKMLKRQSVRGSFVRTMMKALEEKDHITEGHTDRLGDLMLKMGHQLQLPQGEIADLLLLAKFHDIGKVGIPDSILKKPGRLTEDEMAVMRRHSESGYRIAKASPELEPIADLILKHHENWNGRGYPLGLEGESIPLQCRVLGIVDAFDAMTSDRPYRKALPDSVALAELQRCAGTQFDPELVEVFASMIGATRCNNYCQQNTR